MSQFNSSEANRTSALNAQNATDVAKFDSQLASQIDQYNAGIEFQRGQWNAQNAQAVEQSNVNWRRQTNTVNTAAQNAANQAEAQYAYNLTASENNYFWQELRDSAAFAQQTTLSKREQAMTLLSSIYGSSAFADATRESVAANNKLYALLFGPSALG